METNDLVAIKKVLQDKRFKNRELQIMRRLDHCNIIRLQFFFYTSGDKVSKVCLCMGQKSVIKEISTFNYLIVGSFGEVFNFVIW